MSNRRAKWFQPGRPLKTRSSRRVRPHLERLETRELLSNSFGSLVQVGGPTPYTNTSDISQQPNSHNYLNSEVEPRIAVDPTNPLHLVGVSQQDRWNDGGSRGDVAFVSTDGGNTWTTVLMPNQTVNTGGPFLRDSDPWVSIGPDGTVYAVNLMVQDPNVGPTAVYAATSTDGGFHWSNPSVLVLSSNPNLFNDKESVTADPTKAGYAYAVWDRLNSNNAIPTEGPGPALFSRTTDGGKTWSTPQDIYDPVNGQTIGNQIVVLPNGTLMDVLLHLDYGGASDKIEVITSTDKGLTWSSPTVVSATQLIGVTDPNNGQGVRVGGDLPEAAVDPTSGKVYVVWEDSRFNSNQHEAIALSMSSDGGATWSAPIQVNQTPTNIPNADQQAFTPTVAVAANGEVAVSYYDFRNNTFTSGSNTPTDYWIAFANPALGSLTFGHEQRLTNTSFNLQLAPNAFGEFLGDYEGLIAGGNSSANAFGAFFAQTVSSQDPTFIYFRGVLANIPLNVTQTTPTTLTEGQSISGMVGSFTDPAGTDPIADYSATVDWGDGSSSTLTAANGGIVAGANGSFNLFANHAYTEEGNFTVAITVNDVDGSTGSSSAQLNVADALLSLTNLQPVLNAGEGTAPGTVTLATFTDSDPTNTQTDPAGDPSDYTLTVTYVTDNKGDTAVAQATAVPTGGNTFNLVANLSTPVQPGSHLLTMTVTDVGGATISSTSTIIVPESPLIATPVPLGSVPEGTPLVHVELATFTDTAPGPQNDPTNYSATITWDDGGGLSHTSAGSIVALGNNTFAVFGDDPISGEDGLRMESVQINDLGGGATITVRTPLNIIEAQPFGVAVGNISSTEGVAFNGPVAVFADNDPGTVAALAAGAATISWGDGTTTSGVVTPLGNSQFAIAGSHTYAEEGTYTVTVAVVDAGGGATAVGSGTANVADATLTLSNISPPPVVLLGQAVVNYPLALLHDANVNAGANQFQVTIHWGDGSATAGALQADGNGTFTIFGTHTYGAGGATRLTIDVQDVGGASVSGSAPLQIGAMPIDLSNTQNPAPLSPGAQANLFAQWFGFYEAFWNMFLAELQMFLAMG